MPCPPDEREALAVTIGGDGHALLAALYAPGAPAWLREIPAVETLRRVWVQQFRLDAGAVRWRASGDIPPAAVFIGSPHDGDAHYARKDTTSWVGDKLHVTETCEAGQPQLITRVETTSAPVVDLDAVPPIHQALQERDLLPRIHLVDSGSLDARQLLASHDDFAVELLGPPRRDDHWQARERTGYASEHFRIDWEHRLATCPAGRTSSSWRPDVAMPDLSGVELADHLRGRVDGFCPPLLLMSASAPCPLPKHTRFTAKPFGLASVLREIAALLPDVPPPPGDVRAGGGEASV